jgi:transcriptional regulator with GAF, ATPase, and Fis domain
MLFAVKGEATAGQQQVLQVIQESLRDRGAAPTLQEIADRVGKSTGAVQTTLQALQARGYIEIVPGKARGIALTERSALQDVRVTELRAALEAALSESPDLATLFLVAQENLPRVFRMERGILWVKDPVRRRFIGPADLGLIASDGFREELAIKTQGRGEPLWVLDRSKMNETAMTALFASHFKSFLVIPVTEGEQLLGVLAFASSHPVRLAEEGLLEAAQAAASLLVTPLRRAEAQFRLQEDLKLHRLLLELVKQLASDLDLGSLLMRVFHMIEKFVSVDAMFIAMKRPDGLYDAILETDLDDADRRIFFPVPRVMEPDKSKVAQSVEEHRYVLLCRTAEEMSAIQGKPAQGDPWYPVGNPARRSASLLYVPIWFGEEYHGFMSVQSYRMNAYRHEDAERLLVIGEYVGLAVRNARLLEEARKGQATK